jgi:3-phosphoshikimate 1-carboxyvinyltransferase
VPPGGTERQPLEMFVGNAGTAARFLAAFICLGRGVYRLHGVPRMHQRPQAALFQALRELGYRVESENGNDKLPARIFGGAERGVQSGACSVSIAESSQFASALLLCARKGGWRVTVTGENAEESPYVAMTLKIIEAFPAGGGKFQVEPDASSGSYFYAVAHLSYWTLPDSPSSLPQPWRHDVVVGNWPEASLQIDAHFPALFAEHSRSPTTVAISRKRDLGDSILTAIVLSPLLEVPSTFSDLGRLRVQETERVVAVRTELTKCGAKVREEGDTLTVYPSTLHGAEIETYDDHRMAMCFSILGLKIPGVRIKNPACVKKTFPNFYQKLAGAPPRGLGAVIRDAKSGRTLPNDELFAD